MLEATLKKLSGQHTVTSKTLSMLTLNSSALRALPNTVGISLRFGGVINSTYSWLQKCSLGYVIWFTSGEDIRILKQQHHGKGFCTFELTRVFEYY